MYAVITNVQLKSDQIDELRDLFEKTNPDLVKGQTDWVEAKFTANREENKITVLAFWRNADSYKRFSSSDRFKQTMAQFAPFLAGPPQVTINEILFEM